MVDQSKRWLIDGDCSKCRRSKHCIKSCTMKKKNKSRLLEEIVLERTGLGSTMKMMDAVFKRKSPYF